MRAWGFFLAAVLVAAAMHLAASLVPTAPAHPPLGGRAKGGWITPVQSCAKSEGGQVKQPWQRLNLAVYSVSSAGGAEGEGQTMNIATYVSTASLPRPGQPPMYSVALFKSSLSYANVKKSERMLLQLLSEEQADLVELLGKSSGRDGDKVAGVRKLGHEVAFASGMPYMPKSIGVCELSVSSWMDAGDHELALCQVENTIVSQDGPVLYTDSLREAGILAQQ